MLAVDMSRLNTIKNHYMLRGDTRRFFPPIIPSDLCNNVLKINVYWIEVCIRLSRFGLVVHTPLRRWCHTKVFATFFAVSALFLD